MTTLIISQNQFLLQNLINTIKKQASDKIVSTESFQKPFLEKEKKYFLEKKKI